MARTKLEITWATFEMCNTDQRTSFEKMCRMLFNQRFFNGEKLLHSNPNNPGVEVEPIIEPKSGKKISFQAKFFDNINYSQIMHSCKMAVSHYLGDIDIIYLYCNKDVTTTSKSYIDIVNYLNKNNIEIIPITNQSILEYVLKNDVIAYYFFNHISLSQEILTEKLNISLATLGPRYNQDFNVPTLTESCLNVFLCNVSAVERINYEKNCCIGKLKNGNWCHSDYNKYAKIIFEKTKDIPDINIHNIESCFGWKDLITTKCNKDFIEINSLISIKTKLLESDSGKEKKNNIQGDILALKALLELPDNISPSEYDKNLIKNQVLVVSGEAGVGKSQLFSYAAKSLIDDGKQAILLLGGNYLSEQQISFQTSNILDLGLPFTEILYKLEGFALENNCFSYVFIDALNESAYRNIWHSGLTTLLQEISHFPHIKLALSVRDGYEKLVFNDSIDAQLEEGRISRIRHRGFIEESVNATKTFLNYYGIPFLPSYYLQIEMRNPLFLKLFCKTYTGGNYDLFSLFEKLVQLAEKEALANCGIRDSISIVEKLLFDIANVFIETNSRVISQTNLLSLGFWDVYGLNDKKLQFISSLCKSGLLLSYVYDGSEYFQLGYNLLDDFICAKTFINLITSETEIQKLLCDTVLGINEGKINNYGNIDTSVIILGLLKEKYNKEFVDAIAQNIKGKNDLEDFLNRYIMSFIWRKATTINKDDFLNFIRNHSVIPKDVFRVLIENASKEQHPLNALFLHNILIDKKLSIRDAIWTTYINDMANDEERLFQLVLHFDEGNTLDGLSKENTELLLILFVWLFTSSNRLLRDKSSKATIELLKTNFDLCLPLLKRFEGVNDPYVIQRLYGVVFGACTKCQDLEYEIYVELVKYVYENIFMQEKVYPDILLRDYAKLIVEKFVFDYPEKSEFINVENIIPPYKSEPIPIVEKKEYYVKNATYQGYNGINSSMIMDIPDTPGLYGDFGRYVFQAVLDNFDGVDLANAYHYAMQFIRDDLGYSDDVLGWYDDRQRYVYSSRSQTKKIERIGKKYQWIAMHNILARISDHHLIKEHGKEPHAYEGAWEPYVRDFDPTLNRNIRNTSTLPVFNTPDFNFRFLTTEPTPDDKTIRDWADEPAPMFSSVSSYISVKDQGGTEWCALHYNKEVKNREHKYNLSEIEKGAQSIWLIADAFFVKKDDFQYISEHFLSSKNSVDKLPCPNEVCQLFNREYAWSQGYHSIFRNSWFEYELESEEHRIENVIYESPDFEHIVYNKDGSVSIPMIKKEVQKKIPIRSKFVKIAPACSYLLWEEEYDSSQEEATCFYVPCYDLIKSMRLIQKDADGFFYSPNNDLVCFDYRLVGDYSCFLIRMNYLKDFLEKKKLQLCWKCIGEKQYFLGDNKQIWSRWHGLAFHDNDKIHGEMKKVEGS